MAGRFPNLTAMLTEIAHDDPASTLGWCDDQTEFEFGLDLILNGLDGLRQTTRPASHTRQLRPSGEGAVRLVCLTSSLPRY
jgi:hypothetical protein